VSWAAYLWARDATDVKGTSWSVLCALALAADDDGLCWPGMRTLARWAHVSTSTVPGAVEQLSAAGLVEVVRRGRRGHANVYRVPVQVYRLAGLGVPTGATKEQESQESQGVCVPTAGTPAGDNAVDSDERVPMPADVRARLRR